MKTSDLIDLNEAAQISGLAVKTLRRYAKNGKLSTVKKEFEKGYKIFIKREDILNLGGQLPQINGHDSSLAGQDLSNHPSNTWELQIEELKQDKNRLWQENVGSAYRTSDRAGIW